jgi:putative transposase
VPRIARVVVPGYPHHVTQRGNRRQRTFFRDADYRAYMLLTSKAKSAAGAAIWAYCLMPNHVHLVIVPDREDSLARLFQDTHRRYTRRINQREKWRGHLWQERFHSCPMDEQHLLTAVRYVEMNPVRAGLCQTPQDWRWSSVHAHRRGEDDLLVTVKPMLERIDNWHEYLALDGSSHCIESLRANTRSGRPAGPTGFVAKLERTTGLTLLKRKSGPKRQVK